MPLTIEGIVSMLACARLGAIHSVVYAGFGQLRRLRRDVAWAGAPPSRAACSQAGHAGNSGQEVWTPRGRQRVWPSLF
jgi:hypothetical protein